MQSDIITCPLCGTKNRVPKERLNSRPMCGKCHQPLIPDHPLNATDATFNEKVLQEKSPVLVDFWAPWCGPCKMMGPVLDQIAKEYAGKFKIVKINVDENPSTASQYFIQSIPSMLLFKDGKLVHTMVGALSKQELLRQINAL